MENKLIRVIKSLSLSELMTLVFIPVVLFASTFIFYGIVKQKVTISPKQNTQEQFFKYLHVGLNKNLINEDYVKTAFSSFDRKSDGTLSKYGYIESLEDFIVYLNSNQNDSDKINRSSNQIKIVFDLLNKAKETEPYASLPSEEKRLMDHIQALLKNTENQADVNQAMNELKQVILSRHKEYQKIEGQNSWSIPLAFSGVFFTIVFGAWSIVLSIRKKRDEIQRILFEPKIDTHNRKNAEQINSADAKSRAAD